MFSPRLIFSLLLGGVSVSAGVGATLMLNNKGGSTPLTKLESLEANYKDADFKLEKAQKEYQSKLHALKAKNLIESADTSSEAQAAANAEIELSKASKIFDSATKELISLYLL